MILRFGVTISVLFVFVLGCDPQGSTEAEPPNEPRAIIDMHLHAMPMEAFPPHHDDITGYERPANDEEVMGGTLEALERFEVRRAVTSGEPGLLAAYREEAPDRIIPSLMIPPNITEEELESLAESLEAWYEEGAFEVIGEVATQYAGIAPVDPVLEPVFSFAEEKGIPVGIHMGVGPPGVTKDFAPNFRMQLGAPLQLEEVLVRHPDLQLYVMHAGYPRLNEMIALLHIYPQVYADLSVINWVLPRGDFHHYLQRLVEAGFEDRLMFGSDQMIWPNVYEEAVESIESADFLTEVQKDAIFYHNAARFLGLEDD